ncbi:probable UDP-sugar transporter protein SLC35A4 [Sapajus apella]|uniref:Probable UDP-sugar transporter protein SLC35A4 n=1 Tax=Sapajus apella TaxID=9515 RepID=A0A6J3H6D7_SAPAP|nr:probable UDP-sugar transporter protein SLC35A4 [Sapajus apella]
MYKISEDTRLVEMSVVSDHQLEKAVEVPPLTQGNTTITPPEPSPPKGEAGCVDCAAETKRLPSRELLPRQKALFRHSKLHVKTKTSLKMTIMAPGACYAAGGLQVPGKTVPSPPPAAAASPMPLRITPLGLLLLILHCLIPGLSSVYTELLMKRQQLPLALQNLLLYTFGVLLNLGLHAGGGPGPGLLGGFSGWEALVVLSQVLNGLLMSAVMKHGSSITRLFVVACSLVVNALLSAVLLRLQLTAAFFLAALLIGLAMRLYYGSH